MKKINVLTCVSKKEFEKSQKINNVRGDILWNG